MTEYSEPIRYRNQEFAINHLIDDCPPQTVIRELVKNAEENAAMHRPVGRIEWFIQDVAGTPKLGLFNEGPGMTADDLSRLMDLASTGKRLGIDSNFGQGGKISALKVSPHGVIYRSCKQGRVCQIVLAAERRPELDFPVYVKARVEDVTGEFIERENRPLDREWTEVVLLGENKRHNTVSELIPNMAGKNWLLRLINTRFFRFPEDVVVHAVSLNDDTQIDQQAAGLDAVTDGHSDKRTDVAARHPRLGPVTIRYRKLRGRYGDDKAGQSRAKSMETHGLGTRGDHICLVWKNECYHLGNYDPHMSVCRWLGTSVQ